MIIDRLYQVVWAVVKGIQRQQSQIIQSGMQYFDKENSLSFQNITQTMKIKRSKKDGLCYHHPDRPAKYRHRQSLLPYCTSCAIQEASKGTPIEDFPKQNASMIITECLDEAFEECQAEIHEYIRGYNVGYQRLLETLTDIQIRDLLAFNKKLEENQLAYQQLKGTLQQSASKQDLRRLFSSPEHSRIIQRIKQLNNSILAFKNDPNTSLSTTLSPRAVRADYSRSKQLNISSKSLHRPSCRESLGGQSGESEGGRESLQLSMQNTNSLKSRDNSTLEEIKKSIYEDTPESVKLKLSGNSFKVTTEMAVAMFDKIDVCESIDISHSDGVGEARSESEGRGSFSSLKSRYRYQ